MKIKELPIEELPRERLIKYGVENLSNNDLISIILRTGTKDNNVKEVSSNIIKLCNGINGLSKVSINELESIKGLGKVKIITLLAAIELGKRVYSKEIVIKMKLNSSLLIHDTFKSEFYDLKQEKFMIIFLDFKKNLISYKTLYIGTNNKILINISEIYKEAIKESASNIVIIHNHPSGEINPSKEDINTTNKIKEAGLLFDIKLIDSIITNGKAYFSFFDNTLL